MDTDAECATIMVVDDTPANLRLLDGMLRQSGYRVRAFPRGDLALKAIAKDPPDLILLDIMMPGMDGFEVCKRLKADERFKNIPVIFLTALSRLEDKVEAFSLGGADYVTKPFQFDEVRARVAVHIELQCRRREIEAAYARLRELEELRDSLVHMVVHDMRSPFMVIQSELQLALMDPLPPGVAEGIEAARQVTGMLIEMASSMLDISKMEAGELTLDFAPVDLKTIAAEALRSLDPLKAERTLILEAPETMEKIVSDARIVRRILINLISNAIKFTRERLGKITVGIQDGADAVRVTVADNGPGIPAEDREHIFDKFFQVEARKRGRMYSTGLGLTFCKLAVEAHGGRIGVDSELDKGSVFWFELPRTPV